MLHRERTIHSPVSLISISLGTKISARRILTFIPSCSLLYLLSSYLISENVVYLTIAEKSYPRKLAFSYLDELAKEFATVYGPKVEAARKPYAFVGFGQFSLSPFTVSIYAHFPPGNLIFQIRLCRKQLDCIRTHELRRQLQGLIWND